MAFEFIEAAPAPNGVSPTGATLDLFAPADLPAPEAVAVERNIAEPAAEPDTRLICLTVAYGDTLWGIGRLFGVTVDELARMNAIPDPDRIYPGQRLYLRVPPTVPISPCNAYTVKRGDTLSGIAARLGLDTDALAVRNGLFDPDVIYEGQVLRL